MKKIGLYCSTIFHYYIYKNIIKFVPNEYIFVSPVSVEENLSDFLKGKGIILVQEDQLINQQISIDFLISPHWRPSFELYPTEIKMVRMMYGYAKDDWNYAEWNENYDLILSYGPYAQRKLEGYKNSIAVGNPRAMDGNKKIELDRIQDVKGRTLSDFIQIDKQTILYAPTWGELSSYPIISPYLKELSSFNNIIVKAHHLLSLEEERELHTLIEDFNLFYCDERVDIFSLIPKTDLVISDYSGAIFDGILCGVPVALVNNQQQFDAQGQLEGLMRKKLKTLSTNSIFSLTEDLEAIISDDTYIKTIDDIRQKLYVNIEQPEIVFTQIQEAFLNLSNSFKVKLANNKRSKVMTLLESGDKNFVICGCGEYGQSLMRYLTHNGEKIDFFIDNNAELNIHSVAILNEGQFLRHLINDSTRSHYIIATRSGAPYFRELLKKKNIPNGNITLL